MGHGGGMRFDGFFYMGLRFGLNFFLVGRCGFVVVVVVEVGFDMM